MDRGLAAKKHTTMKKITVEETTVIKRPVEITLPFWRKITSGFEMVNEFGELIMVIDNRLASVSNHGRFDLADHFNKGEPCDAAEFYEALAKALHRAKESSGIEINQLTSVL